MSVHMHFFFLNLILNNKKNEVTLDCTFRKIVFLLSLQMAT